MAELWTSLTSLILSQMTIHRVTTLGNDSDKCTSMGGMVEGPAGRDILRSLHGFAGLLDSPVA